MSGLKKTALISWAALPIVRLAAPALVGVCLALAFGATCLWLSRRFSSDSVLHRIIFWSWFLKMVAAISLFYISFWSLPFLRNLQIGSGFWLITRDPSFFDWFSRWIIHCWQTGQPIPGRLFYDQAQQLYCAGIYLLLGPHPLHVIFIGIGLSTMGVILAYDLIGRFFKAGSKAGCLGAGLIAFWPSAFVWSTQMIKEPLILFSIVFAFWCMAALLDPEKPKIENRWRYLAGLCAAVYVMTLFRFYLGGVLALSAVPAFAAATAVYRHNKARLIPRILQTAFFIGISTFLSLAVFYLKPEEGHPEWYELTAPVAPLPVATGQEPPASVFSTASGQPAHPASSAPLAGSSGQPKETALSRKSLEPLTTMMAVRNGYIRTGGASNKASHTDQVYKHWKAFVLLPQSFVASFLEPYPAEWLAAGNDVKAFRRFVFLDMVLIYLLLPGMLLALFDWRFSKHPVRIYLAAFSVILACVLGFSIINVGTLFRLRMQFFLPFIVLWASSPLAMRWYEQTFKLLVQAGGRIKERLARFKIRVGVAAIALVAVLARILFIVSGSSQGPQPLEFSVMAEHLNQGHGFIFEQYGAVYHAYKEPLYVLLLALVNRISANAPWAILLLQGFFGASTAIAAALIARRILGEGRRWILAGLLVAVNPFLLFYDTRFVHPLSLDAFCFLLMAGSILAACGDSGKKQGASIRAGFIGGFVLWERAALLAAGLMSWMAAFFTAAYPARRPLLRKTAVWLGICMLVISPWILRNTLLLGRPIVTSDFGHIFWLGNNPLSNGTYSDSAGHRVFSLADAPFQAKIRSSSELGQSDLFMAEAFRFIRENPGQFAHLTLQRLGSFIWFSPNAGLIYSARQGLLYRAAYGVLLVLGLAGFALFWKRSRKPARRQAFIFAAAVGGVAFVHALTAINLKHRVPFELFLSVFAAEAFAAGWAFLSSARQPKAESAKLKHFGADIQKAPDVATVGERN